VWCEPANVLQAVRPVDQFAERWVEVGLRQAEMRRVPELAFCAAARAGIDEARPGGNAERGKEHVAGPGPQLLIQVERERGVAGNHRPHRQGGVNGTGLFPNI
jgi:hypothetical protein